MDVNLSTEVKGYGLPAVTAVERDEKFQTQMPPVEAGADAAKVTLKEQPRQEQQKSAGQNGEVSKEDVAELAKEIQDRLEEMGSSLALGYSVDDMTDNIIVRLTDRKSGEVVKQLPPKELLDLSRKLNDLVGLLFDKKV